MSDKDRSSLQEYAGYIAIFGFGVNALIEYYLYTQIQKLQAQIDAEKASRERLQESLVVRNGGGKPIAEVVNDLITSNKLYDEEIKKLKADIFKITNDVATSRQQMSAMMMANQEQMYMKSNSNSKSGVTDEQRAYQPMNPQFIPRHNYVPQGVFSGMPSMYQDTKREISDEDVSTMINASPE